MLGAASAAADVTFVYRVSMYRIDAYVIRHHLQYTLSDYTHSDVRFSSMTSGRMSHSGANIYASVDEIRGDAPLM